MASSSAIEPFTFVEIDDDDEPTSWKDVELDEPKYQSLKLLAFPTAAAAGASGGGGSKAGSPTTSPSKGDGGSGGSGIGELQRTKSLTASSSSSTAAAAGVPITTSTSLATTTITAAAAAAAAAFGAASTTSKVSFDDPLKIIKTKVTTTHNIESPDFDAKKFLAEVHAKTSYEDLVRGTAVLSKSLKSEEQQIKQLVANNFNKFIQSKDTIDAVVRQINKNEAKSFGEDDKNSAGGGSSTSSTSNASASKRDRDGGASTSKDARRSHHHHHHSKNNKVTAAALIARNSKSPAQFADAERDGDDTHDGGTLNSICKRLVVGIDFFLSFGIYVFLLRCRRSIGH